MNGIQNRDTNRHNDGIPPAWHALTRVQIEEVLRTTEHGLSQEGVSVRLAEYGLNQIPETPPPSNFIIFLRQFRSPLIYILFIAGVAATVLGKYVDSVVISLVLLLNAIIGFFQERNAERSARALQQLLIPHARVIRNGQEWDIESNQLVPGDIVLLESGSRVPADVRLTTTTSLQIDEALLTGESLPVTKHSNMLEPETQPADRRNIAFQGSIVTTGRGRGYVIATGSRTQLGAIASVIRKTGETTTPLQERMNRFGHVVGIAVGIAAALAFMIGLLQGHSLSDMLLVAIALTVAAIPEGLPVVFTITLALGVQRMSRRNAIVRRLPAVETLGSTTIIGSDKTGTLTQNRMTVQEIWSEGKQLHLVSSAQNEHGELLFNGDVVAIPEEPTIYSLLQTAILTNEAVVSRTGSEFETRGDPTEAALLIAAAQVGIEPEQVRDAHSVVVDLPFEPELQYSASVRSQNDTQTVYVKGAPERILAMCNLPLHENDPAPHSYQEVEAAIHAMAARGLRVLGFATGRLEHPVTANAPFPELRNLTFLGLVGMMDPPREGVKEAIDGCRDAGIRVIMITGDHAVTARAIGHDLGISASDTPVLTGSDLAVMDNLQLREEVGRVSVFARVSPEQKLNIVESLKSRGEVVAVTGDGVNDAPALRAADIGIAMGKSGTDVAREAASMILADDNFVSIYAAVEEGRITFNNVRNVTFFLISTGVATVLAILVGLTFGWPMIFLPTQLIWLNIVTNGLQDLALSFEPGERDVLKRPPRKRSEGFLSPVLWERTVVAGIVMAIGTLSLFWWEYSQNGNLVQAQTIALTTMVLFQAFHVGNSRSERLSVLQKSPFSNPFLFLSAAAALLVHIGALYFPPTQFILGVAPISLDVWIHIVPVAATILIAMELHKLVRRPVS